MKPNEFRKELVKIMPGYKWTVHRPYFAGQTYLSATGIQTSGYNRLSTLVIVRREKDEIIEYEAKSSGYGLKSPWLSEYTDSTLARALRGLQDHYEYMAREYSSHAGAIKYARAKYNKKDTKDES